MASPEEGVTVFTSPYLSAGALALGEVKGLKDNWKLNNDKNVCLLYLNNSFELSFKVGKTKSKFNSEEIKFWKISYTVFYLFSPTHPCWKFIFLRGGHNKKIFQNSEIYFWRGGTIR